MAIASIAVVWPFGVQAIATMVQRCEPKAILVTPRRRVEGDAVCFRMEMRALLDWGTCAEIRHLVLALPSRYDRNGRMASLSFSWPLE